MNFLYAVFICQAGLCRLYGENLQVRPPAYAEYYQTLEACQAAKPPPQVGNFECFKKPDWTPAD